ncbi:MAG: hypothetical protein O7B77_00385 [Actinobacteria bacterium]|nr:hypothetical protein [Actinomycetota bacterium]
MAKEVTEQRARRLVDQIMRDARAHDHRALLAIDTDPDTVMLLDLLPDTATRDANLHLQGARIWRDRQNEKAQDKLDAVKTALDGLDISLAKGLLRKIDSSFLGDSELARFDELLLAAEARAAELEDIQSQVPSSSPGKKQKRRGRFRRR